MGSTLYVHTYINIFICTYRYFLKYALLMIYAEIVWFGSSTVLLKEGVKNLCFIALTNSSVIEKVGFQQKL